MLAEFFDQFEIFKIISMVMKHNIITMEYRMNVEMDALKDLVKKTLDKTYCEYDEDSDGDLYVKTGIRFPVWVQVADNGFIKIFTFCRFKDGSDIDVNAANALVNRMNSEYLPNSVYQHDDKLWSVYFMPIFDGFSERTFINVLRTSADSFKQACSDLDEDKLLM
jgi:hypothetical protein